MGTPLLSARAIARRRDLEQRGAAALRAVAQAGDRSGAWMRAARGAYVHRARRPLPRQPFNILVGCVSVLLPLLILVPLNAFIPTDAPLVVMVLSVALATHLGDTLGGLVALGLAAIATLALWIGERTYPSMPTTAEELITLLTVLIAGAALVWLIQETKTKSWQDRQVALAARAVATALTSIEGTAAAHARGAAGNRTTLYQSMLKAMVGTNRAHVGALLLADERGEQYEVAMTYGMEIDSGPADDFALPFVQEVAMERRARVSTDIAADPRFEESAFLESGVRSALGAPLIGTDEQVIGVVVTGLLARHQFTTTEARRLEALAEKSASVLEAVVGYDERESALQQAEERHTWLERVIRAIPEAVVLVTPDDGHVVAQNEAGERLLGPVLGKDLSSVAAKLLTADGEPLELDMLPISQAASDGTIVSNLELIVERGDGAHIPVLLSVAPVSMPGGPLHAVVAVFREISALKEASRLKDEFVSVVSHELRSPLTPIRGFVQLVARDLSREGGHEEQVRRLNSVAGHVDRMTRLVDDLLDVSRLKAGLLELRHVETSLAGVCQEVVDDRIAGGVKHQILLRAPVEPAVGRWDPDRLYQVVDNLVGNAIKYSPSDGTVRIDVGMEKGGTVACVSVSDEGPGIAAEDRANVFSAFFRTRTAATSQIAGLGLGLYICHELVAAHHGSIEVTEAAGGGAAFTVRLPVD